MYERFYGLHERPFDLTANPRFLFLTTKHREALSNLQYGITSHRGLTLLLGEAGTGKTTVIRAAIEMQRGRRSQLVLVNNPTLTRQEFYEWLATGFGLSAAATTSKTAFLLEMTRHALDQNRQGVLLALVVDEAQSLPYELLEEIRLLSNIEDNFVKLLPVVLSGQPELADRLNEPAARQLKQRIGLRCSLEPLDIRETAAYITKRIRIAGGDSATMFTREAVEAIYEYSRGIPRTINVICDNALVTGFALDQTPVSRDTILEVCRDFDLETGEKIATAARPAVPAEQTAPPAPPAPHAPDSVPAPPARQAEMFSVFGKRRRFSFF